MRHLFVYGTMLRGQRNEIRLADAQYVGQGAVYGWLYQFPFFDFPVFRPDAGTMHQVQGEIYRVDDSDLLHIDRKEKWYKRKVYRVLTGDAPILADLYEGFRFLPYFLARRLDSGGPWKSIVEGR